MSKPRQQLLAELDEMIAEAEEARDFHRGFLMRAEAAGLSLRRGQRLLRQAEERLVQLQRSREVLLDGVQPAHAMDEVDSS